MEITRKRVAIFKEKSGDWNDKKNRKRQRKQFLENPHDVTKKRFVGAEVTNLNALK